MMTDLQMHPDLRARLARGQLQDVVRWLSVPTEPAWCWIPLGMSESDLQLLTDTLNLWRDRLVKRPTELTCPSHPNGRHDENGCVPCILGWPAEEPPNGRSEPSSPAYTQLTKGYLKMSKLNKQQRSRIALMKHNAEIAAAEGTCKAVKIGSTEWVDALREARERTLDEMLNRPRTQHELDLIYGTLDRFMEDFRAEMGSASTGGDMR